jgi:hypothetical protein
MMFREAERAKEEAIKSGLDAEEAERQKQQKLAELAAQTENEKANAAAAAQNKVTAAICWPFACWLVC